MTPYGGEAADRQTDDEEPLPHVIIFDGSDASAESRYRFTVGGDATKSTFGDATVEEADAIEGSTVEGVVAPGSVDAYRFDGEITDFWHYGEASVDVQYDAPSDDGGTLPHLIVFDGTDASAESRYRFTVGGDATHSTYGGATVEEADAIEGSTVEGVVVPGSVDAYRFDGEITDFWHYGEASVDVQYDASV